MTPKRRRFIDEYMVDFNATQAAIRAGYSEKTAGSIGWRLLKNVDISAEIGRRVAALAVDANERLLILGDIARTGKHDSDRIRATELLGKLSGDYVERRRVDADVTVKGYIEISPDDWDD